MNNRLNFITTLKHKQNMKKNKTTTLEKVKSTFQASELEDVKKLNRVGEEEVLEDRESDSDYQEGDELKVQNL